MNKNRIFPPFLFVLMAAAWLLLAAPARADGPVLINEFVAKGTEWVELVNTSDSAVDLTGWRLSDGEGDHALSGSLAANSYLVIANSFALSNDGDQIYLYDATNALVDAVAFGNLGSAPLPLVGMSTARTPNAADTDDDGRDWNTDTTPTPGAANNAPGTALGSTVLLNEINAFTPGNDFYELYNPTGTAVNLTGWQASDGDDLVTLSGTIAPGGWVSFESLAITGLDVMYLWDASGVRVDQLGRDGEFEDGSFQRIPDGVGPNDGFNFISSGGGITYFDCIPTPGTANGSAGCNDPVPLELTIPEIQGDSFVSPYDGEMVSTTGIITLFSADGRSFWMQDAAGDNNPATSDGLYIYRGADGRNLSIGDHVLVVGAVSEFVSTSSPASQPLTEIAFPGAVEVLSRGHSLPAPVLLSTLPNELLTDGLLFWEPLEGMRVRLFKVTVAAPTNGFGEFTVVTLPNMTPGSGFFAQVSQLLLGERPEPQYVDYNPERIIIDNGALDTPDLRPGDSARHMVGVVDYAFGAYRLQLESISGVFAKPLPTGAVSSRDGRNGNLTITTFNVENLFDLVDNPTKDDEGSTPTPEELETQLTKLTQAIILELRSPAILVVQEVENTAILQELGNRINAQAGTNYTATSFETSDGRGIEVGFLWDENRVNLMQAFQLNDAIVPGVSAAFGPASTSPGREPIVGVFDVTGDIQRPLVIIGNHFKSKGGDDPLFGVNQPPIRITEVQRKAQAQVVRDYVNQLFAADAEAWVIVTGDLNDFQFAEPGEGPDHPVAILEGFGAETPLTNLVNLEQEHQRFSYVYEGNSQVLDHMLLSPALLPYVVGHDFLHFNAAFPAVLQTDASTHLSVSDHDPFEARFQVNKVEQHAFTLTVLHNNDGESQLINAGTGLTDFGGVARFKTVVDNLKAEAAVGKGLRGVVMLSSGDNYLAGPEFNASLENGVPFYDSMAMGLIGYDAAAIGNHEFDFGPDVLADFITGFGGATPFVSANLDFTAEPNLQALVDSGDIVKSLVIEEQGVQIGIVGATTPDIPFISSPRNVGVDPDVAGAIQAEIDALGASGVEIIIVISHLQSVAEDLELAPLLSGVDIMIAGGGDEVLANRDDLLVPGDIAQFQYPLFATGADGANIPVVTTAGDYKYVGRLVVSFDADGRARLVDDVSGPVRVAGGSNPDAVPSDPTVQALVVEPVAAYVSGLASNIIATSEVALDGRRNPGVRTQETNEGNLMADSLLWQASELAAAFGMPTPDVALQNGGGIRNNNIIPAGTISELNTWDIAPFANFVSIVPNIPADQFKEIMENAVSLVQSANGRFAQIAGFTFEYDAAGTAQVVDNDGNVITPGTRVQSIVLDDGTVIVSGGVVMPGAPALTVATIDFLARGGDQYPFRDAPFTMVGVTYQQALSDYITEALAGAITAIDYPEGGEGRIVRFN